MNNKLDYKDLIDLEYFFALDKETDDLEIHKRDRQLYLLFEAELNERLDHAPRSLIKAWIDRRAAQVFKLPEQKSPGGIFSDVKQFLTLLLVIKGAFAGIFAGLLFFSYSGTTPVNVFHFLLFFIFSQLVLIFIAVASLFFRTILTNVNIPSFYSFVFHSSAQKVVTFFSRHLLKKMDSAARLNFHKAFGIIKINSKVYGSLFYWPLFLFSQILGIAFNLGLLITTLVKISTSDLAFGWQSTIQLSSTVVHQITKLLAQPWYYLVPTDLALPSLEEVEGSRIILKEGIYHLSTPDLVAWWPFLVFCLLFYGLFLRFFFYGFGKLMERKSLRDIQLDNVNCNHLLRRMLTPVVSTQAEPETRADISSAQSKSGRLTMKQAVSTGKPSSVLMLVPDEIFNICKADVIEPCLGQRGLTINSAIRFMENYEQDLQRLDELRNSRWIEHQELLIIVEGWMVPLVGFMSYLSQLRQILPERTLIHLGLVGCPEGEKLTPVTKEDYSLWEKVVVGRGDPYLHIFPLLSIRSAQ